MKFFFKPVKNQHSILKIKNNNKVQLTKNFI